MANQSLSEKHLKQIEGWLKLSLLWAITRGGWPHFVALVSLKEDSRNLKLWVDRKTRKVVGFESSPIREFEDWDLEQKTEWERLKTFLMAQGVYGGEELTWSREPGFYLKKELDKL